MPDSRPKRRLSVPRPEYRSGTQAALLGFPWSGHLFAERLVERGILAYQNTTGTSLGRRCWTRRPAAGTTGRSHQFE